MADATLRLNLDLSQAAAEIQGLEKAFSKLKIGDNIKKELQNSLKDFHKQMEDVINKQSKLTPEASIADYKNIEGDIKKLLASHEAITREIENQIKAEMQKAKFSFEAYQQNEKQINRLKVSIEHAERDFSIKQAEINILKTKEEITNQIKLHEEKITELKEKAVKAETGREKGGYEGHITRHLKEIEKLNQELETRNRLETEATEIQKKIQDLQRQMGEKELRAEPVKEEIAALKEAQKEHENITKQLKEQDIAIKAKIAGMKEEEAAHKQVEGVVTKITDKMKKLAEFTIAAFAVRYIRQFVNEGLKFIRELDKSLTEIATVTGRTRQEMWQMADEFNRMGRELGKTTNEIARASVLFYRQGLNTNQVLTMVRASTISAAIANTDAAEASNRLTAAIRGYLLPAEAAMSIADKLAALAAKSASSFDELSYAMTKTAASAHVAGIDIDHLYAYIAKVIEATREAPENIGTAFKTIIARMQQIKEAGVIIEDGITTPLNKVEEALNAVGVELVDSEGQLRDLQDVFSDLGQEWDGLNRNAKAYLATIIAGSRQQSRFLALMNDWNRTTELVKISQNSAGEATRQFQTHLTGLEASMIRLTAAKEQLLMNFINSDTYKGVIDAFRVLLDTFGNMHPLLASLIIALTILSVRQSILAAATLKTSTILMGQNALLATNHLQWILLGLAYGQFKVVATGVFSALELISQAFIKQIALLGKIIGVMLVKLLPIAAIVGLFVLIARKAGEAKRAMEEAQEAVGKTQEEIAVIERQVDVLQQLIKEQEELKNQVSRTQQEEQRLTDINAELLTSYRDLVIGTDAFGNIIIDTTEYFKLQRLEIQKLNLELLENQKVLAESTFLAEKQAERKAAINEGMKNYFTKMSPDSYFTQAEIMSGEAAQAIIEKREKSHQLLIEMTDITKKLIDSTLSYNLQWLSINNELEGSNLLLADLFMQHELLKRIGPMQDFQLLDEEKQLEIIQNLSDEIRLEAAELFNELNNEKFDDLQQNYSKAIKQGIIEGLTAGDIREAQSQFLQNTQAIFGDSIDSDIISKFFIAPDPSTLKPYVDFANYLDNIGLSAQKSSSILEQFDNAHINTFHNIMETLNEHSNMIQESAEYQELYLQGVEGQKQAEELLNNSLLEKITLYKEFYNILGDNKLQILNEELEKQQYLLDEGLVSLYNQQIRDLGVSLGFSNEQLTIFNQLHQQFEPALGISEALSAQQSYVESTKELLNIQKNLIDGKGIEIEQMIQLIEKYNIHADQLSFENGMIEMSSELIGQLIEQEGQLYDNRLQNIKASIQMAILKARIELEILRNEASAQLTMAEIQQKTAEIATNMSTEQAKQFIHDRGEENKAFAHYISENIENAGTAEGEITNAHTTLSINVVNAWRRMKGAAVSYFRTIEEGKEVGESGGSPTHDSSRPHGGISEVQQLQYTPNTGGVKATDYNYIERQNRMIELQNQISSLQQLLDNLDKLNLDSLQSSLDNLAGSGGSATDETDKLAKAVNDTEKAIKEATDAIDEYISKLDKWYNITRQILILEQELNRVQKERELLSIYNQQSLINASLEQEILLLRQLQAQQEQAAGFYQSQLQATAIALQLAGGAAITLSDDLKHLHVNQEAYQALSIGEKAIVDELIAAFDELSKAIYNSEMAALDAAIAIQKIQLDAANQYINSIKDLLKKQQKIVIAAIDHELKMLKKAHDEKMKMYDEELDAISKIIEAKIKSIDEEASEEEWEEKLAKAIQEELDLRTRINQLALDDSYEAQAQREALEKELQAKIEQIAKMQRDRQRDLRKGELQDLMNFYKNQFDAKKKAAQEELRILEEQLNEAKQKINYYYQELYNDEQYWAQLRQEIIEGNLQNVQNMVSDLLGFFDNVSLGIYNIAQKYGVELTYLQDLFEQGIEDGLYQLGVSWNATSNLMQAVYDSQQRAISITETLTRTITAMTAEILRHIAAVQQAQALASSGTGTGGTGTSSPSGGGSISPATSPYPVSDPLAPIWQIGYNYGKHWASVSYQWEHQGVAHSRGWAEAQALYGKPVGAFSAYSSGFSAGVNDVKYPQYTQDPSSGDTSSPDGGGTGNWWQDIFNKHEGGIITQGRNQYHGAFTRIPGGERNRLTQLINELFQTKSGEVIGKLLEGEVVINPVANMENLRYNLQSFAEKLQATPAIIPIPEGAGKGFEGELNVYVNNLVADNKEHVEEVFSAIQKGLERMGMPVS